MTPPGEISYDLVMDDDMEWIEGTFRIPGLDWQVMIFLPDDDLDDEPVIDTNAHWESGVGGVLVRWPRWRPLNKTIVQQLLSSLYGVSHWVEVRGPDSMILR
jgi:hypothetical protein